MMETVVRTISSCKREVRRETRRVKEGDEERGEEGAESELIAKRSSEQGLFGGKSWGG